MKKPRKVQGPTKKIDWKVVDFYLNAGCTGTQVAAVMGVHYDTLSIRCKKEKKTDFSVYKQQKKIEGHSKILAKQYSKAIQGDNTMLVWVGKQQLQQKEKVNSTHKFDGKLSEFLDALKDVKSEEDFNKEKE